MSVYVGIDVHRKRSQVAVLDEKGAVQVNRNVVNGVEPILKVIGDLPVGTPVAFEAAYGWGWLVELLETYGFTPHLVHPTRCKAIASARLKNDKVDAATLGQLLRADRLPEAWIAPPAVRQLRALLRHRAGVVRLRTLLRNRIHAVLADLGCDRAGSYWSGVGRDWLRTLALPQVSPRHRRGLPGGHRRAGLPRRPARPRSSPTGRGRPAGQGAHAAAGSGRVHRAGDPGRDRRGHPLPVRPQARGLGRTDAHSARLGSRRPARTHLQTGLGLAALDPLRSRPDRETASRLRRHLPGDQQAAWEEDRHHRGRP